MDSSSVFDYTRSPAPFNPNSRISGPASNSVRSSGLAAWTSTPEPSTRIYRTYIQFSPCLYPPPVAGFGNKMALRFHGRNLRPWSGKDGFCKRLRMSGHIRPIIPCNPLHLARLGPFREQSARNSHPRRLRHPDAPAPFHRLQKPPVAVFWRLSIDLDSCFHRLSLFYPCTALSSQQYPGIGHYPDSPSSAVPFTDGRVASARIPEGFGIARIPPRRFECTSQTFYFQMHGHSIPGTRPLGKHRPARRFSQRRGQIPPLLHLPFFPPFDSIPFPASIAG